MTKTIVILSLVDSLALSDRLLPEDNTEKNLRSAVDYTVYEKKPCQEASAIICIS